MKMPDHVERSAVISDCGKFRYRLLRKWAEGLRLLYVMLNPSVADGSVDDATVRRCFGFAFRAGFGSFEIVNLYAYRATDPKDLRLAGYPVGPENDGHITAAVRDAAAVCIAWGASVGDLERPQIVLPLLRRLGVEPLCLRLTRSGYPAHPLMLASACTLQPFDIDAIQEAMAA